LASAGKRILVDRQKNNKVKRASISRPQIPVSQKTLDLEAEAAALKKGIPSDPNVFSTRGALTIPALVGLGTGGPMGAVVTALGASGIAPALGAHSTQRFIAGQTDIQKYISSMLRRYSSPTEALNPEKVKKAVRHLGSSSRRTAQGVYTDEEE
jgi:hypothetical protein